MGVEQWRFRRTEEEMNRAKLLLSAVSLKRRRHLLVWNAARNLTWLQYN